ncbi:MAG: marine proteobacterial sortase target protein [Gammaproteobacteria bacterium]|jgi:Ca-activated chloride channel family protein|nr:marine proteobacterial sortase target protein [Gammaproteobacteria bacterium]MDH3862432.1 marine proteobacterial sortase target protein [Gammaproteobacteria bacterium]MDH3904482.1 marine proteobacterial sortase target protein [Gammaproteobacteria bacterium]MDH4003693.1 marine proteobacterial sortase target protein [Gammaproteobacteria bacterium]NCF58523.1 marine proteobacterial sortase target protein [Gammaproteobacteria bacterium]
MSQQKALMIMVVAIAWLWMPVATGEEWRPADVQSGTLLLKMQAGIVAATRTNTEVTMTISGLVARVSVRQEFRNEGGEWVEGIYVFPLPDEAAVDRMRLHIGERFIEGEIREKEKARKDYERARSEGRKASLVEQQRPNLFTTSVANIAPGERVVVEIEYFEDLHYDNGTFAIRFPMTLTPRYIPGAPLPDRKGSGWSPDTIRVSDASFITPPQVTESRDHKISLRASIDAGMPLEIVASRYHPVDVSESNSRYTVSLANDSVPMDHDFELLWRPVPSAVPRAMVFSETIEEQPHYLLMVVPPDAAKDVPLSMPRELLFVVDTSGSMHGVSIAQARKALGQALDGLSANDRFNIIEFNSATRALFHQSVAADAANVAHARNFVQGLEANGGTEMRPALRLALDSAAVESHLRQIVFITDGSVGNEEELYEMIEARLGNARLFTVGIGSAPNSWFMRKAAELGRGTFVVISALHEVGEKMDRLFDKLRNPQVTNINVSWPGGTVMETYPDTVPDLYLGEPVTVRAKAAVPFLPGSAVRVSGDSAAGAWTRDLPLESGEDNPGIGALWARAKIAALHDEERRGADPELTRKAVIDTAVAHHLVSKYTSLVAVDKTPVRPAGDLLAREPVPNLLPYGQSMNAIFGFPATATNAPVLQRRGLLMLSVALLLLGAGTLRRSVNRARLA